MKITKEQLRQIIKEEFEHASLGAHRDPKQVFESAHESLTGAHKDLMMLSIHLRNGGFDIQPVEDLLVSVERALSDLNGLVKEDVEKLLSLAGPLKRGTRDV